MPHLEEPGHAPDRSRHISRKPDAIGLPSLIETLKLIVGRRWMFIAALFVFELAIIILVSTSSFLPSEMSTYEKQYNSTTVVLNQSAAGQEAAIFSNNLRVAMYEMVPLVGAAVFGLSLYETARIVEVIGIVQGKGVGLALGTLFFLPSTWLELPAYAIAVAEGFYLASAIARGFRGGWVKLVREIRFLVASVFLVALVLVVAATFEVTEIQLEQGPTPVYAFLTWLPFFVVFGGVLAFWRRARREAPMIEEREAAEASSMTDPQQGPPPGGEKREDGGSTHVAPAQAESTWRASSRASRQRA